MKNKKWLALLVFCVLSVVLASCGNTGVPQNAGDIGENVEEQEQKTKKQNSSEKIFVDNENCTFKISGIEPDDLWGYTLKADLENKTDVNLMFSLRDVSVNGYMCDPFWATSVQSGKKAKSDISFSTEQLNELGIEDVEEIEFTLLVYDEDNWEAPNLVEETFTYIVNE